MLTHGSVSPVTPGVGAGSSGLFAEVCAVCMCVCVDILYMCVFQAELEQGRRVEQRGLRTGGSCGLLPCKSV